MPTIFLILTLLILITFVYAGLRAAPWVPTWNSDIDRFLKLAEIKPGQIVYDLGCGDGRLICAAGKKGAHATGFEISLLPFFLTKIRILFSGNKNTKIKYKDFWNYNLKEADIIYFFLMPRIYTRMEKKLKKELKPGTKIITYTWGFKNWEAKKIDNGKGKQKMYLYEIEA